MNVINEILRINNLELEKGLTYTSGSWHSQYRNSSWVYAGNLPLNLTEGDVICILSQYGEIDDIHLVRDGDSGKSKGFAFVKYADARSAVLAVDNFTGSMVLGRTLRVDHVENYRLPKHVREKEEKEREEMQLIKGSRRSGDNSRNNSDDDSRGEETGGYSSLHGVAESGHAYRGQELASSFDIHSGQDLFAGPPSQRSSQTLEREGNNHHHADMSGNGGGRSEKEERRRRKEERARKRKEKEERRQMKEDRKRRKKEH